MVAGGAPQVFGAQSGGSAAMPRPYDNGQQGSTEVIQLVAGVTPNGSLSIEPVIMERSINTPPMGRPIGDMRLDLAGIIREVMAIAASGRMLSQRMPELVAALRPRLCGSMLPDDTPDEILVSIITATVEETVKLAVSGQ